MLRAPLLHPCSDFFALFLLGVSGKVSSPSTLSRSLFKLFLMPPSPRFPSLFLPASTPQDPDSGGGGNGWIKQLRVLRAFRLFRLFGKMGQVGIREEG
jgi:hypothetical protein